MSLEKSNCFPQFIEREYKYIFINVYVTGFQVTYDISRPPQQRVVSALVRCGDCVVPKYYPLDHNKVYDILVPSFIADGGDNYSMLKAVKERKVLCKSL